MLPSRRPLCKKCKKKPRVSLYFCRECLKKHNEETRNLKRKYRSEGKCVMCGEPTTNRRCKRCTEIEVEQNKTRPYSKSKKAKQGIYGGIKQISEVI